MKTKIITTNSVIINKTFLEKLFGKQYGRVSAHVFTHSELDDYLTFSWDEIAEIDVPEFKETNSSDDWSNLRNGK